MYLKCDSYIDTIHIFDLVIENLKWIHGLRYMNGVPLTLVISDSDMYHEYVWTDASTKEGQGGCTSEGFAFQFLNRHTISSTVDQARDDIDITLFELFSNIKKINLFL